VVYSSYGLLLNRCTQSTTSFIINFMNTKFSLLILMHLSLWYVFLMPQLSNNYYLARNHPRSENWNCTTNGETHFNLKHKRDVVITQNSLNIMSTLFSHTATEFESLLCSSGSTKNKNESSSSRCSVLVWIVHLVHYTPFRFHLSHSPPMPPHFHRK
jgi:hypothetical protein